MRGEFTTSPDQDEMTYGGAYSREQASVHLLPVVVLVSTWCASLLLAHPAGDFPLNDDWSYGRAVKTLLDTGQFKPTGWTSMPLLSNTFWGALFCLPNGFSFNALRASTLVLSALCLIATYFFIAGTTRSRWLPALGAMTLGFNPIYYALSNTFMTDVPALAFMVFAALFLLWDLRKPTGAALAFGVVFAVVATLSRQLGLAVPLAYAGVIALKRGMTFRDRFRGAIPAAASLAVLAVFQRWLTASGRLPASYSAKTNELLGAVTHVTSTAPYALKNGLVALIYLGLFALPILVPSVARMSRRQGRRRTSAILIACLGALVVPFVAFALHTVARYGYVPMMPLSRNVLIPSGIGPLMLRDTYVMQLDHVAPLPRLVWIGVTVAALVGAACLTLVAGARAVLLVRRCWAGTMTFDDDARAFSVLIALVYLAPVITKGFLDRYLIGALPFLIAAVAQDSGTAAEGGNRAHSFSRIASLALLTACALFAVASTRDYLQWNRVRWQALNDLVDRERVSVHEIDGGFEFNGWYSYRLGYRRSDPTASWWWVDEDTYQLAFGPMRGYGTVKEYDYRRWLPPGTGKVLVLKREPRVP